MLEERENLDFTTALSRWIILILWVFWFIHYWLISYLMKSHDSITHLSKSFWNILTLAILGVALFTILFTIAGVTIYNLYPSELWRNLTGVVIAVIGFASMYWSRFGMGRLWLAETGLKREHHIINNGIYGIIRHPIYAFTIVFYLGSVLVFSTWWTWAAFLVATVGYICKALEEEAFLIVHLPGYDEYQQQVRYRFIPGIW